MIPTIFIFLYLTGALSIGLLAFRRARKANVEDFFLAGRSIGSFVFVLSLFGTHMTAFSILGASGFSFTNGIMTFGLMASSSALVVPVLLFFIGTRLWALGKRHGFMTPVQMFRDRWECSHTGTLIFAVQAALLVPYIIIGVMGGGTTLEVISGGRVPYWAGGLARRSGGHELRVFGRHAGYRVGEPRSRLCCSWSSGTLAVFVIGRGMGGFGTVMERLLDSPSTASLLSHENVAPLFFLSYMFIPLSAIAFPHIGIFCLTARRMKQFKHTMIFYPLCILAVWVPSVYLGRCSQRGGGHSGDSGEAPGARPARRTGCPHLARRTPGPCGGGAGGRCAHPAAGSLCFGLARRFARCGNHGGRDGQRLTDPGAVDDVRGRHFRLLRGQGTIRRTGSDPDGAGFRHRVNLHRLPDCPSRAGVDLHPGPSSTPSPAMPPSRLYW